HILPQVEAYMAGGGERLVDLVENLHSTEIGEDTAREWDPELLSFVNVNTKEDLNILERYGRKES
ncbi:MAG: hypothetical protein N3C13_01655, partial [Aquificaceae bacterium]|nr:hypothetical protein [Aquificaceae bacterium]